MDAIDILGQDSVQLPQPEPVGLAVMSITISQTLFLK